MATLSLPPLSVYYCYDTVDIDFWRSLDVHLDPLKRRGWIRTWDDQQIRAGANWKRERETHLHTARLLILLISADFLASESGVRAIEVALQRHRDGEAVVLPILVRAANWEETDLDLLQVLPREQKPITAWQNQDDIWREVAKEIQQVIQTLRQWVFVAASPQDQEFVARLRQELIPFSVHLWSLEDGQEENQRDAMRAASAVILVASPDAPSSRLVKAQSALAEDYRPIVVVWARGEDWKASNPGNWREQDVVDVRGRSYETARKLLLRRLRQVIATLPSLVPLDPPTTEPRNPYKGLHAFTSEDAGDFFGRGALIDELAATIETMLSPERQGGQQTRLLSVIGPSGSGKSSVVMAGLLPRLKSEGIMDSQEWVYLNPIFPGVHPLEALAISFAAQFPARSVVSLHKDFVSDSVRVLHLLACQLVHPSQRKVVLVIDQFEELFTLTVSEEERQHFLDLLVTAVTEPSGPVLVILTLRADFYDRLMQYPEFYQLFEKHHISVLLMGSDDLRTVIEQPAYLPDVQLIFDGDLVGDLLFEMRGQAGALPLLQFTLDQLFERRDGHLLSLQAYHDMGGVKGALSQHAEQTYAELPSDEHRRLTQALFLRLIELGASEQEITRRRVELLELTSNDPTHARLMHETIDAFIKARLLTASKTTDTTTIEVSHEAVLREWKRIADWLHEAYGDILIRQDLSKDAAEWEQHGKSGGRLYRGVQLKEARDWAKRQRPSEREQKFLRASATLQTRQRVSIIVVALLLVSSLITAGGLFAFNRAIHPDPTLVTTLQDNVNGSLRYCIENADFGSTIRFASDLHGIIHLQESLDFLSGKHLTVQGPGANQITISGGKNTDAHIHVPQGAKINISGLSFKNSETVILAFLSNEGTLTIADSLISGNETSSGTSAFGGGIDNLGILTVMNSTISNNTVSSAGSNASSEGGGIFNQGTLTVMNSTISNNTAVSENGVFGAYGGGIDNVQGTLTVKNSTISKNIASGLLASGGGIENNGGTLTVTESTFTNNGASSNVQAPPSDIVGLNLVASGGGIENLAPGTLEVKNSTFSGNSASGKQVGFGGGINNGGKLTVTASTFANNVASSGQVAYGGGILNAGMLSLVDSTLAGNLASALSGSSGSTLTAFGGGIENSGVLSLVDSTLAGNSASGRSANFGGGIANVGKLTMVNSAILNNSTSGNRNTSIGGGITCNAKDNASITMYFSTIYGNTSYIGGGISVWGGCLLTISESIVAANSGPYVADVFGSLTSDGYNLITSLTGVTGLNAPTDRQVALSDLKIDTTLRNNGGPTQTLALLPGSLALDVVPQQACSITITDPISGQKMTITTDQRGDPRPDAGENTCDIGAYESSY